MNKYGESGCGDHSCSIARPSGMGTNGGCRCDSHVLKKAIWNRDKRIAELEEDISEMERLSASSWHPASEEPKKDGEYLISNSASHISTGSFYNGEWEDLAQLWIHDLYEWTEIPT